MRRAVAELDLDIDELVDDVDTFVRDAADRGLRLALGHLFVDRYQREHGAFTQEELDRAQAEYDAASRAGADQP